ncbi:replicative DNA helicase [Chlamydia pneumoniae TW-183]|uniref:Replicative DNA helicase n=3 Tax=Chlamydia pneumoniae TaxID=83558 RepID=Q9K2D6_CHLPN|nr:replicative DNA helicase [Chlamydia pneumoniae]AAF38014.1 replicative DNA helicase [Chlamydia pneumoniae AR39]AAP98570.1 replicative DNA helicase [Chlamydia pneumoniae TW-183]CRI33133.1 Replicative DNA helicase [Chlamydia pneumoniae]CRI35996.1 Replicative DNA helicase [Chlamydia pneumoniae]CRI37123.1 Replicative DNA helicase [Chlamydia pneumoniae]
MDKSTGVPLPSPPHSKESEMIVLGCMLTGVHYLNLAANQLYEEDFYYLEHKIIFRVLQDAFKQDKPIDVHLAGEELKRHNQITVIGGPSYLITLAEFAGTAAYLEEYVDIIRSKSILRKMISTAKEIEKRALEQPKNVAEALDEAQNSFFKISQSTSVSQYTLVADKLRGLTTTTDKPYLVQLQERQELFLQNAQGDNKSFFTGIPTHFIDLDQLIHGFSPSNLMILAARPAMGKTALALNIAENLCFQNRLPIGIFSLEMTVDQLIHRMICSRSEVDSKKISIGDLSGHDFQRIVSVINEMQEHTLLIDDQPGLKVSDLRARARRMKESYDIQFLIIDYLQLLSGSGTLRATESRQTEISEISRMLKTLARELNIPILCLSQLSRKVEDRANHRPMMSDLRESGSIEQDSDLVMFLLRREYYDPNDKPGTAELIIAKNRHGSIGSVPLVFEKELARFRNYSAFECIS